MLSGRAAQAQEPLALPDLAIGLLAQDELPEAQYRAARRHHRTSHNALTALQAYKDLLASAAEYASHPGILRERKFERQTTRFRTAQLYSMGHWHGGINAPHNPDATDAGRVYKSMMHALSLVSKR